ncbi:hypothetical protein FQN49_007494, partial [Arthroderma sp. PD_2]
RPEEVCEAFTAYFPADISAQIKEQVRRVNRFPTMRNGTDIERADRPNPMGPMDDPVTSSKGWIEGVVEFKGQACVRFVYFALWMYPDSPKLYKESQRWLPKVCRDGRTLNMAMEVFLDDLKDCGMPGHESVVGRLEVFQFPYTA